MSCFSPKPSRRWANPMHTDLRFIVEGLRVLRFRVRVFMGLVFRV